MIGCHLSQISQMSLIYKLSSFIIITFILYFIEIACKTHHHISQFSTFNENYAYRPIPNK